MWTRCTRRQRLQERSRPQRSGRLPCLCVAFPRVTHPHGSLRPYLCARVAYDRLSVSGTGTYQNKYLISEATVLEDKTTTIDIALHKHLLILTF